LTFSNATISIRLRAEGLFFWADHGASLFNSNSMIYTGLALML